MAVVQTGCALGYNPLSLFGHSRHPAEPLSDSESIQVNEIQHSADSGLSACLFSVRCMTSAARQRARTALRGVR